MPSPLALIACATIGLWSTGCASERLPPRDWPLERALATLGTLSEAGAGGAPLVVLIEDRHSLSPRLQAERGPIVDVRRDSFLAVRWLVDHGFAHLGCEYSAGPLPKDGQARQQREILASLQATGADVDAWNLFQPLRYEVTFGRKLAVRGVEDTELYESDVRALDGLRALDAGDAAQGDPERLALRAELFASIQSRVAERGTMAGRNLLAWLQSEGAPKGILILGAAHAEAATSELIRQGARVLRLRTHALERREKAVVP